MASIIFQIILENILEAVYFSLFILFSKKMKSKSFLFIIANIFLYLGLKLFLKYNIWFQILYIGLTYMQLKLFYKEKAIITDVFMLLLGALFLMIISIVAYVLVNLTFKSYILALVLYRIMLFVFVFLFRNKISKIHNAMNKYWNRHSFKNKIKSLTLRNICAVGMNIIFFIIALWLNLVSK